jgi:hypothetical protein
MGYTISKPFKHKIKSLRRFSATGTTMTSIHHNTSANMALDPVPAVLLHGFNVGFIVIGQCLLILTFLVILNALCVYLIASASFLGRYEIDDFKTFSKTFLGSPKIKP